jgi:hypothetical protein
MKVQHFKQLLSGGAGKNYQLGRGELAAATPQLCALGLFRGV